MAVGCKAYASNEKQVAINAKGYLSHSLQFSFSVR